MMIFSNLVFQTLELLRSRLKEINAKAEVVEKFVEIGHQFPPSVFPKIMVGKL